MAALSSFGSDLLEEAKHFLEMARGAKDSDGRKAFLHAALMLGFAAFEAHLNAIADDFLSRADLSPHERGLLAEQAVDLVDGEYKAKNVLKIHRIEDRVLFLCRRFSTSRVDRKAPYWSNFLEASHLRNRLTHPKSELPVIGDRAVERALHAIIELLNFMYTSIYKKKLPAYNRGLSSKLTF
ncbi:hypothetical protein [Tunturiibacter psychrotolerans]|uniref:hypothetical protein n=1 Tax=Tunturiibacter psychrotolerans TaxID=3069686 RepID=UPI003D22AE7A